MWLPTPNSCCLINTEIDIPASPEQIWAVFSKWEDWGRFSFMAFERPPSAVGKRCRVVFTLDSGCLSRSVHEPEVLVLKENRELRWRDYRGPLVALFFRGSHWWVLEPLPNGHTRVVHGAEMRGLVVPFLWKTMAATKVGYTRFNEALRAEVLAHTRRSVGRRTAEASAVCAHAAT